MTKKLGWLARAAVLVALGITFAGATVAQTSTTTNVRNFEVISVDGNQLVFRDERGTNTLTVPDGFRFTVDGKQLAIGDLKAGMKGTAVVTTTTTVTPVTITEIRKGMVLDVGPSSVTIKDDADGHRKRFTQAQLNDRGIKIIKDGRVTHVGDVQRGDEVTAMIVSQAPPVIVTEQEVQATLAQAAPATTATTATTQTTPAPPSAPARTEPPAAPAPAAAPAASAEPPAAAPPMAATPASAVVASSGLGTMEWLLIILVIGVVLFFFSRRRKPPPQ